MNMFFESISKNSIVPKIEIGRVSPSQAFGFDIIWQWNCVKLLLHARVRNINCLTLTSWRRRVVLFRAGASLITRCIRIRAVVNSLLDLYVALLCIRSV